MCVGLQKFICSMCMQVPKEPEKDVRAPGTGVSGHCMSPGCWELNSGSL